MKRVSVLAAFVMTAAAFVTGCSGETGGSSETGSVSVNLIVGNTNVTAVTFEVTCNGLTLNGQFNVNDEQDPPVWAAIMDLPEGPCTVTLTAFDLAGAPLCTGGPTDFTVVANETVKVNIVLTCLGDEQELLGTVDIDATFEEVPANNCPRLYFLNAVPDEVPLEGSTVTVLVGDADGDTVTTLLTTPGGGSFADPTAQSTTYTCDNATGNQTISVTASDGDTACDKSKSFDVTCPGVNPCEGVVCDDTGNDCTVAECNQETGQCEISNVENDTACEAGGIVDVAVNGSLETGDLFGWQEFCDENIDQICQATNTMANTGDWSARIFNPAPGTAATLKQNNKGVDVVQPGDTVTINFFAKGTGVNGGVAFAEFFSEIEGGGTSNSILLGNAPLALTDQFQAFNFMVTAGSNVSGGVTVQFNAATGANEGSTSELFVDDLSITVEGGGAGTCQEGECVPSDLCAGVVCDDTGNECTVAECNAANGLCEVSNVANDTLCNNDTGTCQEGQCVTTDLCEGVVCDDTGNDCTVAECNAANGLCEESNVADETACNNDGGKCNAGFCVPAPTANGFIKTLDPGMDFQVSLIDTVDTTNLPDSWGGYAASISIPDDDAFIGHILQFGFQTNASNFDNTNNFYDNTVLNDPTVLYTQDFNGLDINGTVIGDDWRFFVNVFDSAGTRKFGYGGAAPNGTGFISGIVSGEGGLEQEPQQLSVFSDYNCCQPGEGHFSTDLVETNVFQERTIGADDLGKTLEFVFQAKGGNIGQ